MTDIQFDRYYRYEELTQHLQAWAEKYPTLCRLDSMGKSYEGRDIWVLTLTNFATGPDNEKPAFWSDGNIHATEVSASTAVLHLIHKLLTGYGKDANLTYALDSRVIYAVPRLNPDGAEWALADIPKYVRSSTRPYPRPDELDGLHSEDIDKDGRILQMRVKDPHGPWKIYPDDPRLMVLRAADDPPGGDYYRVLPEGRLKNYDGVMIKGAPALQGLDLNRQFPVFWEPKEGGAGKYPGSEPETQAAMRFIADHPNITGGISFHTFSGVHLRPSAKYADDQLPTNDLRTFQRLGDKATELTGYPALSIFHDFNYEPKEFIRGGFDDWLYEHYGLYAWTTEIWSVQQQAGLKDYKYIDWWREHPLEDDIAIMKWNDDVLNGKGWIDWYEFDHPQLGNIELGGWDFMVTWRNPPYHLLEKEIAPLSDFVIYSCLSSPKLEWHSVEIESQGNLHHIRAVVQNSGWLPTHISEKAKEQKVVLPLEINLDLPDNTRLITGEARTLCGQLAGRDQKWVWSAWSVDSTEDRGKAEWVIEATPGTEITITAVHQRAGTLRQTITL